MNLFLIQDADRPMYVVAPDWGMAVAIWEERIRRENDVPPCDSIEPPLGIQFVCDEHELILPPVAVMPA